MGSVFELERRPDRGSDDAHSDPDHARPAERWTPVEGTDRRLTGTTSALRIDALRGGAALRVAGDIDHNTVGVLAHALDLLPPAGECHLYLEGVDFIGVAGVVLLVTFSRRRPDSGEVVLHSPPRDLLRIAAIGWPDYLPEIRP